MLFSAAVPGQGGEFHVNEQPLDYWREFFLEHGYRCFDALRPHLLKAAEVQPWYRYNTLLYVKNEACSTLPDVVLQSELAAGERIPELAPPLWRARNAILGATPQPALDLLVKLKHSWVRSRSKRA